MARGSIRIGGAAAGSVTGLPGFLERLQRIPAGLVADIHGDLSDAADEFVSILKPLVPVSEPGVRPGELEAIPGQLRDSVHKEDGQNSLSVLVVEDAVDAKGNYIGPHVELGHKDKGGGHVAAQPHFYPAIRLFRPKLRARLSRTLSKRVKAANGQ